MGLKTKREVLANMIEQYEPTKHAPECIAEGGQGMILVGKDLGSGERVAIKVERVQQRGGVEVESALQREFNVLYALKDDKSFPDILHFGRQVLNSNPEPTDCRVMVMDLLGASIADLWWETTHGSRGAFCFVLRCQVQAKRHRDHDSGAKSHWKRAWLCCLCLARSPFRRGL